MKFQRASRTSCNKDAHKNKPSSKESKHNRPICCAVLTLKQNQTCVAGRMTLTLIGWSRQGLFTDRERFLLLWPVTLTLTLWPWIRPGIDNSEEVFAHQNERSRSRLSTARTLQTHTRETGPNTLPIYHAAFK